MSIKVHARRLSILALGVLSGVSLVGLAASPQAMAQAVPEGGFINDVRVADGYAYLPDSSLGRWLFSISRPVMHVEFLLMIFVCVPIASSDLL